MKILKSLTPHIAAIIIFLGIAIAYFSPIVFDNKDLRQGDVTSAKGWAQDTKSFHKEAGENFYWSNSMFGGMPYNFTNPPATKNIFSKFSKIFKFDLPSENLGVFFVYLLGVYIFLLALGINPWLSILGSIAYALCSYNLIIINAGHINKGLVMSTMAPVIGGIILVYRKKYIIGSLITLIFTGINIFWSHQQISYYLLLTIIILAITYLVYALKKKEVSDFFKSSGLLIILAIIAILPAADKLIPTYDYTKNSMRGGQVLNTDKSSNTTQKKSHAGLDIDYAFQWSYGKMETLTLLIPNLYGGSSSYKVGENSQTYKLLRKAGYSKQGSEHLPMYWGAQPFTAGPVYAGAIICFLFILGLIIVKGTEKWWILFATILSIILSWGKNFPAINDFLFYNLPFYSKFRTPSMSLVITNLTMVTLSVLAIKEIITNKDKIEKYLKPMYIALGLTGGLSLFFALFGSNIFDFKGLTDSNYPAQLLNTLVIDRKEMLSSDSWRSLYFIVLSFATIYLFIKNKIKKKYLIGILTLLIFIDLWNVDRRFLGTSDFVPKREAKNIMASKIDKQILQDKDPDYRVMNLTSNTFNESNTSYFHKSIGGYSPAKLRRYQDIIDYYLSKDINMNVLNMLNTKYFIINTKEGKQVQRNTNALGNAWFVNNVELVETPNQEIEYLKDFNPKRTAVMQKKLDEKIKDKSIYSQKDTTSVIKLSKYNNPGYITYSTDNKNNQLAVFSEVYYKTWNAYIDGKKAPLLRVNYILRGLEIPAGKHTIELKCYDKLYVTSAKISTISSFLVIVIIIILLYFVYRNYFVKNKENYK